MQVNQNIKHVRRKADENLCVGTCFSEATVNSAIAPNNDLNLAYRSAVYWCLVLRRGHRRVQRGVLQREKRGLQGPEGKSQLWLQINHLTSLGLFPALKNGNKHLSCRVVVRIQRYKISWHGAWCSIENKMGCCNLGISNSSPLVVVTPTPAPGPTPDLAERVVLLVCYASLPC